MTDSTLLTADQLRERLQAGPVVVELGCGPNPPPGVIGVDSRDLPGVSVIADLENGLPFLPDDSVDEVRSRHLLEHVDDLVGLLREIHRVLRPGGTHSCAVPHFSNPYYYSDPTHERFFGLYTFDYLSPGDEPGGIHRTLPRFYFDFQFRITSRLLVFGSDWTTHRRAGAVARRLFNRTTAAQEFYERHLCWQFPCQEIHFTMTPVK